MTELEHIHNDVETVIHPMFYSLHFPKESAYHLLANKLQGPMNATYIYKRHTLYVPYCLDNPSALTTTFLKTNKFLDVADPESIAHCVINTPLESFKILQLAVATCDDDPDKVHQVLCTGPE